MSRKILVQQLKKIVGPSYVLTGDRATRQFCKGFRTGQGKVVAVVRPATLLQQWQVLQAAHQADCIVIMQAANTGLTGGSTPDGDHYDRDVILINTLRINNIQLINEGKQVICLPGATLDKLEKALAPLGREPHSVIGSSCIGASVLGGVCNNSGGALVRRGPVYTEQSLFAQINANGELELINHLGIDLGSNAEEILSNLQKANYTSAQIDNKSNAKASGTEYAEQVKQVDADSPARFNANPQNLFEAAGSAGKLCIFAVRLDTFEKEPSSVFYIGTNNPSDLTAVRRHMLTELPQLPIAGEYIHKTAFDIGAKYGKDAFLFFEKFGTASMPKIFSIKSKLDYYLGKIGLAGLPTKLSIFLCSLLPDHLPKRIREWRQRFEHHLLIRVSNDTLEQTRNFLQEYFKHKESDYFECNAEEGRKAFLLRFAVASAAVSFRDSHRNKVEDIVALDIALRRNDKNWVEELPADIEQQIIHKLYYGHFFCHVFHQDYIVKKGTDPLAMEHKIWDLLDARRAEYPAEHNVGHLYYAKPALAEFYRKLDPTNSFNPGIGHTSKNKNWR